MAKYILAALIIFGLSFQVVQAAETCQRINIRPGLYCSTEMGNVQWHEASDLSCAEGTGTCCCGPEIASKKSVAPKYIIMASVIAFFGILVGSYFFIRKNDQI